jgi:hypothetical protein
MAETPTPKATRTAQITNVILCHTRILEWRFTTSWFTISPLSRFKLGQSSGELTLS